MTDKKSMTVRLSEALHERLRAIADLRDSSMADVVREALEAELPRMAARQAEAMEERLERLRAVMKEHPDLTERSISEFARAEAEVEDPLETEATVEREDDENDDLSARVRNSFAGMG